MLISAGNEEPTGVCGFTDKIHGHAGSNPSAHGPAVVIDLFAPEVRRNPWPVYDQLRAESPVLHVPPPFNGWMVFDYETVKWIMTDHASFSSRIPAPNFSFIFTDPPEHTRLRNLISRAFTPRAITDLEPTSPRDGRGGFMLGAGFLAWRVQVDVDVAEESGTQVRA